MCLMTLLMRLLMTLLTRPVQHPILPAPSSQTIAGTNSTVLKPHARYVTNWGNWPVDQPVIIWSCAYQVLVFLVNLQCNTYVVFQLGIMINLQCNAIVNVAYTLCVSSAASFSQFATSLSCANTFFGSFCNGRDHLVNMIALVVLMIVVVVYCLRHWCWWWQPAWRSKPRSGQEVSQWPESPGRRESLKFTKTSFLWPSFLDQHPIMVVCRQLNTLQLSWMILLFYSVLLNGW